MVAKLVGRPRVFMSRLDLILNFIGNKSTEFHIDHGILQETSQRIMFDVFFVHFPLLFLFFRFLFCLRGERPDAILRRSFQPGRFSGSYSLLLQHHLQGIWILFRRTKSHTHHHIFS